MWLGRALRPIRGLWAGIEMDLIRMGIRNLNDLAARDPILLADAYCVLMKRAPDPVIEACFVSISRFASNGAPVPWWLVMRERLQSGRPGCQTVRERGSAPTRRKRRSACSGPVANAVSVPVKQAPVSTPIRCGPSNGSPSVGACPCTTV